MVVFGGKGNENFCRLVCCRNNNNVSLREITFPVKNNLSI